MTEVQQTARPEPPGPARRGMKWAAQPADDAGIAEPGTTCRYKIGGGAEAHGQAAVLFIWRGIGRRVKWNYCAGDAGRYGYWVKDGAVLHWVQVPDRQET